VLCSCEAGQQAPADRQERACRAGAGTTSAYQPPPTWAAAARRHQRRRATSGEARGTCSSCTLLPQPCPTAWWTGREERGSHAASADRPPAGCHPGWQPARRQWLLLGFAGGGGRGGSGTLAAGSSIDACASGVPRSSCHGKHERGLKRGRVHLPDLPIGADHSTSNNQHQTARRARRLGDVDWI